jgi:hypothetical protein
MRRIPNLVEVSTAEEPGVEYPGAVLENAFNTPSTEWMYTAIVQLALNGSPPAWTMDDWSFVPLDISTISNGSSMQNIGHISASEQLGSASSSANISVVTPAVRGRLECTPYNGLSNLSAWAYHLGSAQFDHLECVFKSDWFGPWL